MVLYTDFSNMESARSQGMYWAWNLSSRPVFYGEIYWNMSDLSYQENAIKYKISTEYFEVMLKCLELYQWERSVARKEVLKNIYLTVFKQHCYASNTVEPLQGVFWPWTNIFLFKLVVFHIALYSDESILQTVFSLKKSQITLCTKHLFLIFFVWCLLGLEGFRFF